MYNLSEENFGGTNGQIRNSRKRRARHLGGND